MGRTNEFSCMPKLRACPCCGDNRRGFSAPHERPGISLEARSSFDRDGFASEHGLIEQERSLNQLYVGCRHPTERQLHGVTRRQFGGGYILPSAVAPYRSRKRQSRLERGKSGLCARFLEET